MVGRHLIVLLVAAAAGCTGSSGTVTGPGDDDAGVVDVGGDASTGAEIKRQALRDWAQKVIRPGWARFQEDARGLETAAGRWAASGSAEDETAAQDAWRVAMGSWQEAELYQIGPAGIMGDVPGGQDLRDSLYSFPLVNRCRVDQELVEQAYADVDGFATEAPNVRGLDAIEHLLFRTGTQNACAANSLINTSGEWAALTPEEITARRGAYAATLATLVLRDATALLAAWDGGAADDLITAGQGSAAFDSVGAALNTVSDALFYLDIVSKDQKLISEENAPPESPFAMAGKAHLLANLRGFRAIFTGAPPDEEGVGFDDILRAIGAGAVADEMLLRLDAAVAAVDAIPEPLEEAFAAHPDAVELAYAAVKAVTDLMKTQFVAVLDLELPAAAASDND